jgi:demethylmenaquinone methyltransferase/2-methoxy-6-polyprenyl-1,4-benzoquinol methylase
VRFDEYPYGSIAAIYDGLADLYSLGRIAASKRGQLSEIEPGDRVLYAGVGRGEDAVAAAARGAHVTAIDLAPRMLARVARRLEQAGLAAELVEGDVAQHAPAEPYDVVVANYFLNLFEIARAREMLVHLAGLVRPGGKLLLTDFAPARGGALARAITGLYYRVANWIAWLFGFCALHPIPEHVRLIESVGLRVERIERYPVLFGENPAYVAITARRADEGA